MADLAHQHGATASADVVCKTQVRRLMKLRIARGPNSATLRLDTYVPAQPPPNCRTCAPPSGGIHRHMATRDFGAALLVGRRSALPAFSRAGRVAVHRGGIGRHGGGLNVAEVCSAPFCGVRVPGNRVVCGARSDPHAGVQRHAAAARRQRRPCHTAVDCSAIHSGSGAGAVAPAAGAAHSCGVGTRGLRIHCVAGGGLDRNRPLSNSLRGRLGAHAVQDLHRVPDHRHARAGLGAVLAPPRADVALAVLWHGCSHGGDDGVRAGLHAVRKRLCIEQPVGPHPQDLCLLVCVSGAGALHSARALCAIAGRSSGPGTIGGRAGDATARPERAHEGVALPLCGVRAGRKAGPHSD